MQYKVLLINLGTPSSCNTFDVYKYLREFLMDRRVVNLPYLLRFLLVNVFIAPFRCHSAAKNYQKIWSKQGSPLLVNSQKFQQQLQQQLPDNYQVELGMRYGAPSIAQAVQKLLHNAQAHDKLIIFPLYPQYASSSTGAALEKSLAYLSQVENIPNIITVNNFFTHPEYINAQATVLQQHCNLRDFDHILFSFHSIPTSHLQKSCQQLCPKDKSCDVTKLNTNCYRAQCYITSHLIAQKLQLTKQQYSVSFQSRLGKIPWVEPYTDHNIQALRRKGVEKLLVVAPSFTADCIETLEELGVALQQQWQKLGGVSFMLASALNAEPAWLEGAANILLEL